MVPFDRRRNAALTAQRYSQSVVTPDYGRVAFDDDEGSYVVTFAPQTATVPDKHVFRSLMSRPALAEDLANVFLTWGASKAPITRAKRLINLTYAWPFFDALAGSFRVYVQTFDDIDTDVFSSYIDWLDCSSDFGDPPALADLSKLARYNALRSAYTAMCRLGKHRGKETAVIPEPPWRYEVVTKREPLNLIDVAKLLEACRSDMRVTLGQLQHGAALISERASESLDQIESCIRRGDNDAAIVGLYKYRAQHFGKVEQLRMEYPRLGNALKNPNITVEQAMKYLVLTYETVVPFVLFFALETAFNPSELFGLSFSHYVVHPFLSDRKRFVTRKGRKGENVSRSFPARDDREFSVPKLVDVMRRNSMVASNFGTPQDKVQHLFLCHSRQGGPPRPFINEKNEVNSRWYASLEAFLEKHDLIPATLTDLRLTVSDLVHLITNGDILAQKRILNHASISTTMRSYGSSSQKARNAAKLARAMTHRQRYIDSRGKIALTSYQATGLPAGATPGFNCLDLETSPIPGEFDGRPCSSYGRCPSCPHAVTNLDDAYTVARLINVRDTFVEARAVLPHLRWLSEWEVELRSVEELLRQVKPSIADEAKGIRLPPIPRFE